MNHRRDGEDNENMIVEENGLRYPKRVQLTDDQTFSLVEQNSNIPMKLWKEWEKWAKGEGRVEPSKNVTTCGKVKMTKPFDLYYNNEFWQVQEVNINESLQFNVYLYQAYWDSRGGVPRVRLISTTDMQKPVENLNFR